MDTTTPQEDPTMSHAMHKLISTLTTLTLAAAPALTASAAGAPAGLPGAIDGGGPPAGPPPGMVLFDDTWLSPSLATSLANEEGDTLLDWTACTDEDTGDQVDDCVVLVVGDEEVFSTVILAASECDMGAGCYAGYRAQAWIDTEAFELAPNAMMMRVKVYGGIATSPLGVMGGGGLTPTWNHGLQEVASVVSALDFRTSGYELTSWVYDAEGTMIEGPLVEAMIAMGSFTCEDLGDLTGDAVNVAFDGAALAAAVYGAWAAVHAGAGTAIGTGNPMAGLGVAGFVLSAYGGVGLALHWTGESVGDFTDGATTELCEWAMAEDVDLEDIEWQESTIDIVIDETAGSACLVCSEYHEAVDEPGPDNGTMQGGEFVVEQTYQEAYCAEWTVTNGLDDNLDGFCD
jgi:hypothetical protein